MECLIRLFDTKQSLDAEINLYRKMLDGDKNKSGLKQLVEQAMRNVPSGHSRQDKGERCSLITLSDSRSRREIPVGQKLSCQRSAKGNVTIQEVSPEGHFIVLQNTHRSKDEKIGEWKIKRRVHNHPEIVFTFPKKFVLKSGKSVRICAKGWGANLLPDQIVDDHLLGFGVGANSKTVLVNKDGDERAVFVHALATS